MSSSIIVRFYEPDSKHNSMTASQFYSYSQEDICLLDINVVEFFLSSELLVVWDENSLLEMILELDCDHRVARGF
jgi:hypothetical protein